jgi:hypothetical protein
MKAQAVIPDNLASFNIAVMTCCGVGPHAGEQCALSPYENCHELITG